MVVSLAVDPPSATVHATGTAVTFPFRARATWSDLSVTEVQASWALSRAFFGAVALDGTFSPQGGGLGVVTASFNGFTANADVTVYLALYRNDANLTPADQSLLEMPTGPTWGSLLYPQDGSVFPLGLLPPDVMWTGGSDGDVYRVTLGETYVTTTFDVAAGPQGPFTLPASAWHSLDESNVGEDVTLGIGRLSGGVAYAPVLATFRFARARLGGLLRYTVATTGVTVEVVPGTSSPSAAFDPGRADQLGAPAPADYDNAMPPWDTGGNNVRCTGCHAVSARGNDLAAIVQRRGSLPSPWATWDLQQRPAGMDQNSSSTHGTLFLALSPDGQFVVVNSVDKTLRLHNALTGQAIPSALDLMSGVAVPAFSPDGTMLAFAANVLGAYPLEFYSSDLNLLDFDGVTSTFSNQRTLVNGAAAAISFPSFTPDSRFVIYQQGDYSRARYGSLGNMTGYNDLFMVDVAGLLGPTRLAAANGAALPGRNQLRSYMPSVSPVASGGYYWIAFTSPRDYGSLMLSLNDPTVENRKQLWLAAVDLNVQPGVDPSHPAVWMPGQDLSTINLDGKWALKACAMDGATCAAGHECCGGYCTSSDGGPRVCAGVPAGQCALTDDHCDTPSNCCDVMSACVGGFCTAAAP